MHPACEHRFRFFPELKQRIHLKSWERASRRRGKAPRTNPITVPPTPPHCIGLYAYREADSSPYQGQPFAEGSQSPVGNGKQSQIAWGEGWKNREVTVACGFVFWWQEHEPQKFLSTCQCSPFLLFHHFLQLWSLASKIPGFELGNDTCGTIMDILHSCVLSLRSFPFSFHEPWTQVRNHTGSRKYRAETGLIPTLRKSGIYLEEKKDPRQPLHHAHLYR